MQEEIGIQLELHTQDFEEHRSNTLSSLLGRMRRFPWMRFEGERRSTRSIMLAVEHRTELGNKFVRQTAPFELHL